MHGLSKGLSGGQASPYGRSGGFDQMYGSLGAGKFSRMGGMTGIGGTGRKAEMIATTVIGTLGSALMGGVTGYAMESLGQMRRMHTGRMNVGGFGSYGGPKGMGPMGPMGGRGRVGMADYGMEAYGGGRYGSGLYGIERSGIGGINRMGGVGTGVMGTGQIGGAGVGRTRRESLPSVVSQPGQSADAPQTQTTPLHPQTASPGLPSQVYTPESPSDTANRAGGALPGGMPAPAPPPHGRRLSVGAVPPALPPRRGLPLRTAEKVPVAQKRKMSILQSKIAAVNSLRAPMAGRVERPTAAPRISLTSAIVGRPVPAPRKSRPSASTPKPPVSWPSVSRVRAA
ncbi:hypothetical protein V5799_010478 [Amblyomma americanum]|uniref:Uncharacterized protein n=1 Tax=Amblyomma americanum TaxID=6943 RepID=A0AAQ4EK33_AMBAM